MTNIKLFNIKEYPDPVFFATHKLKLTKNAKGVSSYYSSTATSLNMYVHSEFSLKDLNIK